MYRSFFSIIDCLWCSLFFSSLSVRLICLISTELRTKYSAMQWLLSLVAHVHRITISLFGQCIFRWLCLRRSIMYMMRFEHPISIFLRTNIEYYFPHRILRGKNELRCIFYEFSPANFFGSSILCFMPLHDFYRFYTRGCENRKCDISMISLYSTYTLTKDGFF